MKKYFKEYLLICFLLFVAIFSYSQSTISIKSKELNIDKNISLKPDVINEDDPNDLEEAWSYLISYFGESSHRRFELRFPARKAIYHWTQESVSDKNDSLSAELTYNADPNPDGNEHPFNAFAKDFSITITRYDSKMGGVIEGSFNGIMQAYLPWSHQTVSIPVNGNFHTTRNGKGAECRKQRRAEKAVIDTAVTIFDDELQKPIRSTGWHISEETNGNTSEIANHPSPFRPIFMCSDFYTLTLLLDAHSEYGKMISDSLKYYQNEASKKADNNKELIRAISNISRLRASQHVQIKINANAPYLKEDNEIGSKDKSVILHIPGVEYAWQYAKAPENEMQAAEEKTMLFFGNWKGANMHAGAHVAYPFIHKKQSPFIENFVVTINAPASVANEIIKKIDWEKLNGAITR